MAPRVRVDPALAWTTAVAATVVGVVLAAAHVEVAADAGRRRARAAARAPSAQATLEGYWVWSRDVEDGAVARAVSPWDLAPRVGPTGWPGCPENVLCTPFGVRKLAVGPRGRAHYVTNVTTSSDFQFAGALDVVAPGLARFALDRHYSCAHPGVNVALREARWLAFRRDGDELWLGVTGFDGAALPLPRARPSAAPRRWLVMRRVPRAAFYGRSLIRRCQPEPGADCHPECFSDALGE